MTPLPEKASKKLKEPKQPKQTPEARLEAMRYNHMMYGPTEGELSLTPKKVDYGASYLKHPKFQSLIAAFKRGGAFKFEINTQSRQLVIATEGSHISFDGKSICYARSLNKHEDNLFLDRGTLIHFQTNDALVHLVFAVLRSFPELGVPDLAYQHHKFYAGNDTLEFGSTEQGANLLMGSFKASKVQEKPKN